MLADVLARGELKPEQAATNIKLFAKHFQGTLSEKSYVSPTTRALEAVKVDRKSCIVAYQEGYCFKNHKTRAYAAAIHFAMYVSWCTYHPLHKQVVTAILSSNKAANDLLTTTTATGAAASSTAWNPPMLPKDKKRKKKKGKKGKKAAAAAAKLAKNAGGISSDDDW